MCKVSERSEDEVNENQSFDEFVQSLTPAKKRFALSLVELYKRDKVKSNSITKISCSDDIYRVMYPHMYGLQVEEMWCIFLNSANKIIRLQRFTIGGRASTVVDVRVILKEALLCNATCMVAVHCHPSGNPRPSMDDDNITNRMKQVCEVCNIRFLDHLIFSNDNFYSYSDEGKM